eukprot:NODE_14827_length_1083_cov_3.460251.p2 GENE.NODE_14827_length_1083_cov_3.460251~~NODE_14827_length_1083_cov_3.460251.p2  ORF type:complete len:136 (+),score=24.26 NODE_14827_length_1083_cov_3.460251:501-908(+)
MECGCKMATAMIMGQTTTAMIKDQKAVMGRAMATMTQMAIVAVAAAVPQARGLGEGGRGLASSLRARGRRPCASGSSGGGGGVQPLQLLDVAAGAQAAAEAHAAMHNWQVKLRRWCSTIFGASTLWTYTRRLQRA